MSNYKYEKCKTCVHSHLFADDNDCGFLDCATRKELDEDNEPYIKEFASYTSCGEAFQGYVDLHSLLEHISWYTLENIECREYSIKDGTYLCKFRKDSDEYFTLSGKSLSQELGNGNREICFMHLQSLFSFIENFILDEDNV